MLKSEVVSVSEMPIVRIQRAAIRNFRNVESGEIRFPCNYGEDIFAPKADVLGIYVRMDRVRLRLLMRWRF